MFYITTSGIVAFLLRGIERGMHVVYHRKRNCSFPPQRN
jgi:hypothetical protein